MLQTLKRGTTKLFTIKKKTQKWKDIFILSIRDPNRITIIFCGGGGGLKVWKSPCNLLGYEECIICTYKQTMINHQTTT